MWQSSAQAFIICLFKLVHVNDLHYFSQKLVHLDDLLFIEYGDVIVKEVNVKETLKSSIFVVQKAAAPKIGVEFRQGSIDTIRSSLATPCDVARRRATLGAGSYCCCCDRGKTKSTPTPTN